MMENNLNANPGDSDDAGQTGSAANTEQQGGNEQNPQEGKKWDNYQTRELSANEEGGGISAEEAAKVFEKGEE